MRLTVGEISKVLGLPSESIRYYVREGLIQPEKNAENNYWEYSSEDLLLITDIMFYRDMGLSIHSIHEIFDGLPLEEIGTVIARTKDEINEKLVEYTAMLQKVQSWASFYREELESIGKITIGEMPANYRISRFYDQSEHMASYLKDSICVNKDDWERLSISFLYDFKEEPAKIHQYISLEKNDRTTKRNRDYDVVEEKACPCIMTHAIYTDDIPKLVAPLIQYAEDHGITLTGEIYGRERTNFYVDKKRHWVCSIYAPIVTE
ncbi:MAG: MerR family transcriptional regulator [Firmicutes bacterium]|nr:MerR family transcriptional regulator [Bacillota bacterium]